jgi:RND family efflux transporter MFP subunit
MTVSMTSNVTARVTGVSVDVGSLVGPGDVLVQFDSRLYAANLASARASYAHAHQQLGRIETLAHQDFASPAELEDARVTDAQAYGALVKAEIDLDNTTLRSPAAAVVVSRSINPGETSEMHQVMLQLGILDPVVMDAAVAEDKVGCLFVGMPGQVTTDAFPGIAFIGSVARIDSSIKPGTRTISAYVRIENHDLKLQKGTTAYARLMSHRMVLAVPSASITNSMGDRATVFVIDKMNHAHTRRVRVGLSNGGLTEILSGVDEGEKVVAASQFGLHDNELVQVNQVAQGNQS